MTLGFCIAVFVSFLVFMDQSVRESGWWDGGRGELRTDGTEVSICELLCV